MSLNILPRTDAFAAQFRYMLYHDFMAALCSAARVRRPPPSAVWFAGIKLSDTTDVLSKRLHLGEALAGLILLAVVTNLPEIAITITAALRHSLGVAVGNILGGIALQTVVLVLLDIWGVGRSAPLTYRAASLELVLEGVLVVAVLVVVIMGTQLPPTLHVLRMTPSSLLIAALWLVGLWLLGRARKGLPWHENGQAPDNQKARSRVSRTRTSRKKRNRIRRVPARRSSCSPPPLWSPWRRARRWNRVATPSPTTFT